MNADGINNARAEGPVCRSMDSQHLSLWSGTPLATQTHWLLEIQGSRHFSTQNIQGWKGFKGTGNPVTDRKPERSLQPWWAKQDSQCWAMLELGEVPAYTSHSRVLNICMMQRLLPALSNSNTNSKLLTLIGIFILSNSATLMRTAHGACILTNVVLPSCDSWSQDIVAVL